MDTFFKQGRLSAIIFIIFGIILLLWPGGTLLLICQIVGWGVLIAGVVSLITALRDEGHSPRNTILSLLAALIGLFIALNPGMLASFLPMIIGIVIICNSFLAISQAVMGYGDGRLLRIILGVVSLFLGILIVADPFSTAAMVMSIVGIAFIYTGIMNLINFRLMR